MNEDFDLELFFTMVEKRPVLWDKTLDIYKDRIATRNAWKEVCIGLRSDFEELGAYDKEAFGKEIIRKWTNIRDAYAKSTKREKEAKKSGMAASKLKKYVYSKELEFLSKLYKIKAIEVNSDVEGYDEEGQGQEVQVNEDDVRVASPRNPSPTGSNDPEQDASSRKRRKKPDNLEMRIMQALENEKPNRHLSFFQGIIPSLDTLEEHEVLKFQMGVLQLISNITEEKRKKFACQNSIMSSASLSVMSPSSDCPDYISVQTQQQSSMKSEMMLNMPNSPKSESDILHEEVKLEFEEQDEEMSS